MPPQNLQPTMTQQGQQQGPPPPPDPSMGGSPGGEPTANPPGGGGGGGAQPQGKMGKLFGGIGSFLKANSGAIADIGNQLAAAGGNYRPMMLAHQDREYQLQKSLQDSQLQSQELSRQLTRAQLANIRSPEQESQLRSDEAGRTEAARVAAGPGTPVTGVTADGGYGLFSAKGPNATPITTHQQIPNPDYQAYDDVASGGQPPNLVQDWNKGAPPTMPKTISDPNATQLAPLPKGMTKGDPLRQPDGSYVIPVFDGQKHIVRYEHPDGTPLSQVPIVTYNEKTTLKDTPQGTFAVQEPSTTTKGPAPPTGPLPTPKSAAPGTQPPPTAPPVPNAGGPTYQNPSAAITGDQGPSSGQTPVPQARAAGAGAGRGRGTPPPRNNLAPGGVKITPTTLTNTKMEDWVTWRENGKDVAGPAAMAGPNPVKLGQTEGKDILNARSASDLLTKRGDPNAPETQGVLQLIDSLDKDGKLGILASRYNSFMVNGIGTSPGDDPRIVTLINKNMLADTLVMLAHFGASGGRSPLMLQHFLDLSNSRSMDGPTLKAGTLAIADYMMDKSKLPQAQRQQQQKGSSGNHPDWFEERPQ